MEPEEIRALLNNLEQLLRSHDGEELSNGQWAVLYGCLSGPNPPYKTMAGELRAQSIGDFKWTTLKNDGSLVFQRLSGLLGEKVVKGNCKRKLEEWYNGQQSEAWHNGPQTPVVSTVEPVEDSADIQRPGDLVELPCWQPDLTNLTQAIHQGRRVVCIYGAPRIGKTCFTHLLVERLKPDFESVVWCQAPDVQTVDSLYRHVSRQINQEISTVSPVSSLSELLHTRRILLVIDNTNALYKPHQLAGRFKETCIGYENWLKRLLEGHSHNGCLVWVGREPPACFECPYSGLVSHSISKLAFEDAAILLEARGMVVEPGKGWENLVDFCGGNPAWLLLETPFINRLQTRDVFSFLSKPSIPNSAKETLQDVLRRLSDSEYLLLVWLLLKPVSYERICALNSPDDFSSNLGNVVMSLERRALIKQNTNQCYQLDLPMLEYIVAEQVAKRIEREIAECTLETIRQHPLFHGSASACRQNWQRQYLLQATARGLKRRYAFRREQMQKIQECFCYVKQLSDLQQGYAIANLLNLAITLDLPLAKFDCRGLVIHHADLHHANLRDVEFEDCTFGETLLPVPMEGGLVADMPPDGGAIAAGDRAGRLFYWKREGASFILHNFHKLPTPIDKVIFQASDTLIIVSNQTVHSWWLDGETGPEQIMETPEPIVCLAQSPSGHIAAGLADGKIVLWHDISRQEKTWEAHENAVCNLSFSSTRPLSSNSERADSLSLASIGYGNRVLVWTFSTQDDEPISPQQWLSKSRLCVATSWDRGELLRAELNEDCTRLYLWRGILPVCEETLGEAQIFDLSFSKNGHYLVGSAESGIVFHWDWKMQPLRSIKPLNIQPQALIASENGRWLLMLLAGQIQLYDLHKQELFWQITAASVDCTNCNLQGTKGLTSGEQELMRSLGANLSV